MNDRSRIYDALLIVLGAFIAFIGTVFTELWLGPAKQAKIHQHEIIEHRLSKLYAPLVLATGKGAFSMTSDLVFYKVQNIMDDYSYLADSEVVDKYIKFVSLCRFAGYEDLRTGTSIHKPLSSDVILEIVKQRKPPLKWTPSSLKEAIQMEKDFNIVLLKYYDSARKRYLTGDD